jgi:hypothetical protein
LYSVRAISYSSGVLAICPWYFEGAFFVLIFAAQKPFIMKRLIITILIALSAFATADAQYANNAKYRDLKGVYDHKE